MKRLLRAIAVAVLLPALAASAAADATDPATRIKAAFVLNFLKYVEWPRAGDAPARPLVVAVVGRNAMHDALKAQLERKTVAGRSVEVRSFDSAAPLAAEAGALDAVYVDLTERAQWNAIRDALGDRPVLTVAEMPGFCASGGMLNLYEQDKRVRFEANPEAARARGLKVSSQLLQLAKIVDSENRP